MTALALDVRELSFDEIECVSGGSRLIRIAQWFGRLIRDGLAIEAAKALARELQDIEFDPDAQDPYTLAKIG